MIRLAVLAVLMLFAFSCNWFMPEGQVINDAEESLSCSQQPEQGCVRYMFVPTETDSRERLARCLSSRGVILYTTSWCPACDRQKALFGRHVEHLNEVDCGEQGRRCEDAQIRSVPTWTFRDGQRHVGLLSLRQLARRAGCSIRGLR